jgi:hypothetical protein
MALIMSLQRGTPSIHADPGLIDRNITAFNPMCLAPGDAGKVVKGVRAALS